VFFKLNSLNSYKKRTYTPDVLAIYQEESKPPLLIEVKYRSDIKKNWIELKPKFKAAIAFSKTMGWRFKILTEIEIRTPYMKNAHFLFPYVRQQIAEHNETLILCKRLTNHRYYHRCPVAA
jgi:hypothetical protein